MNSNVYDNKMILIKNLVDKCEFDRAYENLKNVSDKCAEWYYLNSIASMNLGFYEESENSILQANSMSPENMEYKKALESYNLYRNGYREESRSYNRRKRRGMGDCCCCDDCCCCCCGDDCCNISICDLWCLDSVCECFGGDLIECC